MKRNLTLALAGYALVFLGCSDGGPAIVPTETGGTNGSGGLSGTGGKTTTASGGAVAAGGANATGGATATGGRASGGSIGTGGASAIGGVPSAGGASQPGGQSTGRGGSPSTGGTSTKATGGASATGGAVSAGGASQTGGQSAAGGSLATSGTSTKATGGASATGGAMSAGGTSGAGAVGGVPHVTPQSATSVPSMYGNPVANPGKLTTGVTYSAYYYSTSLSSPLPPPTVAKQTTPKTKTCNVYTPPGYDPQTQYPLIVIMHGITDSPDTWNERSNPKIATLFDNLITSKATKPFIAVFASGTVDNSTNAYYAFGGELVNDLLPFIESKYSVTKDRGSRAMAGFSFGGMQTLAIGLCAHLKEFAWFAGLDAAGPGTPSASDIAKYVAAQTPETYPLYYLYIGVGASDSTASGSSSNAANGLASKGPYITSANFSFQNNIPGYHDYPTAEVSLYNFLRMAFATIN